MAVYRIYFQHDDGRLEAGAAFHCGSDLEAVAHLPRPTRPEVRVELWQGGRWIGMAGLRAPASASASSQA